MAALLTGKLASQNDDGEKITSHIISVATPESETYETQTAATESQNLDDTNNYDDTYNYDEENVVTIRNPAEIKVLVNKYNQLPEDYAPEGLVIPDVKFSFTGDHPKKYLRSEAAYALQQMFLEASKEGCYLFAVSGYRSFDKQSELYTGYLNQYGKSSADMFSAQPGKSEHQTGLAMDVSAASVDYDLVAEFGESDEGKWLEHNAYKFGFILRYPSDKTEITGYMYEPWHFRYIGDELAYEIYKSKLTLEEYFKLNE